jgi:xanthine dehydrogenase accessory factor
MTPIAIAHEWRNAGHGVALATVIKTWGSAPRQPGSILVIRDDGQFEGSVSGGCVEGAVIAEARQAIATGAPKRVSFGVADETAWAVGLACGGQIDIYIEQMQARTLDRLADAERRGEALVRAIRLTDGHNEIVGGGPLAQLADEALRHDRSGVVQHDGQDWFLQVLNPPVHLIIAGAVHIAQSLSKMASELGWRVTIVDPRTGWANAARFPGVTIDARWPDEAMPDLNVNPRTAIVTLTHDPKLDDPALKAALKSACFYIGALGSKKTHGLRRERLSAQGFSDPDFARIHGPVGLSIGALSPAEIAVSILGQIVQRLRAAT